MQEVKVFSTPDCIYCNMAKEFFKENHIKFKEFNVAENKKAREEMIEKSGQMGVPVIEIEGQIIVGFNKDKIKSLL